jgi:hypothetical protein
VKATERLILLLRRMAVSVHPFDQKSTPSTIFLAQACLFPFIVAATAGASRSTAHNVPPDILSIDKIFNMLSQLIAVQDGEEYEFELDPDHTDDEDEDGVDDDDRHHDGAGGRTSLPSAMSGGSGRHEARRRPSGQLSQFTSPLRESMLRDGGRA